MPIGSPWPKRASPATSCAWTCTTRTTEDGVPFDSINAKGYVPVLVLDDGAMITENIAILSWIAEQAPALRPEGPLGWFRLLEATAYISTELHKGFHPFFHGGTPEEKAQAVVNIGKRLDYLAEGMTGDFLLGPNISVADAYLWVISTWARRNKLQLPAKLDAFYARMLSRETVRTALAQEACRPWRPEARGGRARSRPPPRTRAGPPRPNGGADLYAGIARPRPSPNRPTTGAAP